MKVSKSHPWCRSKWICLWLALLGLCGPAAADTATGHLPDRSRAYVAEHRLLRDIEEGVARVEPWLERYGYGAVFVAVGVEGIGIPAPGQTILEAGSAAAASDGRLQIGWILAVAFLAASLGNSAGYLIGRVGGRDLLRRLHIDPKRLDKMEGRFERYGGWLILFARFFDGTRQLNGIAAGMLGMPWARFTLFSVAGAALWAGFWGLGVYYLDLHLDQVVAVIRRINPWVAAATVVGLVVAAVLAWRLLRRRPASG